MKKIASSAILATGTLLLSGCSFSLPSEADQAPCEALSSVFADKLESLPDGGFDVQALVSQVESDVVSSAPDDFKELLEKMKGALTSDPIAAGDLTTAATQIGVRCALVGVNVEFPSVESLLGN